MTASPPPVRLATATTGLVQTLLGIGGLTVIAGALLAPDRMWPNLLLVSYYLLGLGLGGALFVAIQHLTAAGWSVAIRRVAEGMVGLLPVGGMLLWLVLLVRPSLYAWAVDPALLDGPTFVFKRFWLQRPFFLIRAAGYLTLWTWLAFAMIRPSRQQDTDGDPAHGRAGARRAAVFLVGFALTFWLASFDWLMSLEPHWFSTIFWVYDFAGWFLAGLACLTLAVIGLERAGPLRGVVTAEHRHDLGKLLFAFATFWMYLWFSQYMLIWYVDLPEETGFFVTRIQGAWSPLFLLNLFLNWVVPFFVLMPRRAKRNVKILAQVAVGVLAGRWLDLYLTIAPTAVEEPAAGLWELGLLAGGAGLALHVLFRALASAPAVAARDPLLSESLHFHQ